MTTTVDLQEAKMATRSLRDLPKAHLHTHLDGSYPVAAVQNLAARRGVRFDVPASFTDVWQFFDAYGTVPELVQGHEDLAELCRALVHAEAAEGVRYLEPAIEPQLYSPRLGSLHQVTFTMTRAFAEAAQDTGIEVGALLTINTDENLAIAEELATVAARHAGTGVTALGTAGFVEPAGLHRFLPAARIAKAAGLEVVSHAGQTGGPSSVEEALNELGATRISHGFRATESPELLARMAAEGIGCDVCPVSNQRLGLTTDIAKHPAPQLLAAGVPITLNADDQLWFSTSITEQYEIARDSWGLGDTDLAAIAMAGTRATGMTESVRQEFTDAVGVWLTTTAQQEGTS